MRHDGYALFNDASRRFEHHYRIADGSLLLDDHEGARQHLAHMEAALRDAYRAFIHIPADDEYTHDEDLRMRGAYLRLEDSLKKAL